MIERLGTAFREELVRLGPAGAVAPVVDAWPHVVGDAIASNAWPARLARDRTLHVTTSSSAWAFELAQLEPDLLERLRNELSGDAPARLRFAPGPLPELSAPAPASAAVERPAPGRQERAAAAELAAPISDAGLRGLVARAVAASLARARDGRAV